MKTTPLEENIAALARPVVAEAGRALVAVRVGSGVAQILAEDPVTRNLGIEDCAALHRALAPVLAAARVNVRLEVSSPGADRPLTKAQDFVDFAGREAKIELDALDKEGQKRFRGVLAGLTEDGTAMRLEIEGWKADIPLTAIARAKLVANAGAAPHKTKEKV
ncbi:MAG TPA: ribosome maturation factor RimP [Rhodospirillaceae bacterium]|jgi:ribosome maturation factor RimP|nr:ribosome maturation factor RimP [Alphaproteobacteria bacterium]HBH26555.1 ribosome maturation factor RimP [Rhodospirillaceae bacterium]